MRRGTIPSRIHPEMGGGTGVMARLCGRTRSIAGESERRNKNHLARRGIESETTEVSSLWFDPPLGGQSLRGKTSDGP